MNRLVTTTARLTVLMCTLGLALLGTSVPASAVQTAAFDFGCNGLTCTFSLATSAGADDDLAYAWNFGDTTTGTGTGALHRFLMDGTYAVTLTVSENNVVVATETQNVPVSAATGGTGTTDEPPVAVFDYGCSGLTCRFNASQSTDETEISSYAWDFDDEASGTGVILLHTFPGAGSYDVILTVTDNNGIFTSTTQEVTVTITVVEPPTAAAVTYVGSRSAHAATRTVRTRIPSAVEEGDRLVLVLTVNDGTPGVDGPAPDGGWKRIGSIRAKAMKTIVWTATASATSAEGAVRVSFDDAAKASLTISAYDGAGSAAPTIRLGTDLATTKARSTPAINAETGAWVLSYWADKSSQTTEWTTSRSTSRQSECGTGAGHICSLLADSSASVPAGQYDGVTARTDHPSSLATLLSIELMPAS
jgi:PKD repeat protein